MGAPTPGSPMGGFGSGEVDCAVSTQESSTFSPQVDELSGNVSQQEKGLGKVSDVGAADPVPTPEKVEPILRLRKKLTKGVPRFKVMKDRMLKVTPKEPTTAKVKRKKVPEDDSVHVQASSSNIARRKLDMDSSEGKPCFGRAILMGNLRCLAKTLGLSTMHKSNKKGKKRKHDQLTISLYQGTPTDVASSSLVPLEGSTKLDIIRQGNHGKKVQCKVFGLDEETLQICESLRKWDESESESFEGFDIGSGPTWDARRRVFEHVVDVFIATVSDLLGPRKFSPWGGSVIDSVVGTFLTQNVTDNLSSNAFMELVAKFPPSNRHKYEDCSNVLVDGVAENLNSHEASDVVDSVKSVFKKHFDSEKEDGYDKEVKKRYGEEYKRAVENFITNVEQKGISTWDNNLINLVKDRYGNPVCSETTLKKFIAAQQPEVISSKWGKIRDEACAKGYSNRSQTRVTDAVDWESVLHAPRLFVAKCIEERGQHYVMAGRIQAFLKRISNDQDRNFDLEWLRYVSRENAKDYLLSIHGIGDKSVDCIRLLSLRHKAFPVDVNVARIVTRLGWVELQPFEGVEFHLINEYPIMRDVQRYLWPRLCTIEKEKLYELHCDMITFGKVICTKINPNCSACPFSADCKYYKSSFARLSLPSPEKREHELGYHKASMVTSGRPLLPVGSCMPSSHKMYQHQIEISKTSERQPIHNCEPIVEVPPSPGYEYEEAHIEQEESYEDYPCDLEDVVPEVQYDDEIDIRSNTNVLNNGSWKPNYGKDLVLINPQCNFGQNKRLKNIGRLRTEHSVYVLPDAHPILEDFEFEGRVPEDPCHYLLVVISCPNDYIVKGTVLIPCRTANGGKFPLNGTYFQENEVFADHLSSQNPLSIHRDLLYMLKRCIVYFGSSIHSITKGQSRQDIQECFQKGYICVRGFDRRTRRPKRLCGTLHATNIEKKEGGENLANRDRTSPEGKSNEKATSGELGTNGCLT